MFGEKTHSCILFQIMRLKVMHLLFFYINSPTPKPVKAGLKDALGSSFSSEPCAAHRLGLLGLDLNKQRVGWGLYHH